MTMHLSIADQLLLLRGDVDDLLDRLDRSPGLAGRPLNWTALAAADARNAWTVLTEFVDWLRDRYGLTERIPACWYQHPAQLEELSALRTAWAATFANPAADPAAPLAWHDGLDRVLVRLRDWDRTGCADGQHREDLPPPPDPAGALARERFIHDDLAARTASTNTGTDADLGPPPLPPDRSEGSR